MFPWCFIGICRLAYLCLCKLLPCTLFTSNSCTGMLMSSLHPRLRSSTTSQHKSDMPKLQSMAHLPLSVAVQHKLLEEFLIQHRLLERKNLPSSTGFWRTFHPAGPSGRTSSCFCSSCSWLKSAPPAPVIRALVLLARSWFQGGGSSPASHQLSAAVCCCGSGPKLRCTIAAAAKAHTMLV